MTTTLTDENRAKLKRVSTATLTTALFKRGFRNVFMQGVRPLNPEPGSMVGRGLHAALHPRARGPRPARGVRGTQHPQRKGDRGVPARRMFVIDSRKDPRAASAGGILVTRLMQRGVAGIVTDGGFRDSPRSRSCDPGLPRRPSAPTNLIRHHAVDLNVPIACGDVAVYPGDIMVGDGEGVVVIPAHLADEIARRGHRADRL